MKYYRSYMDRQALSPSAHERLLNLKAPKRARLPWARYGALAACATLILGVGAWKLAPSPAAVQYSDPKDISSNLETVNQPGLESDRSISTPGDCLGDWETNFVVSSSGRKGTLAFPMIPGIEYPDRTESPDMALSRAYMPGAFTVDLTKEDIQTIFWGPEGNPEAETPKTGQGDLPWMLFWDGYTVRAHALYDNQGQLAKLTVRGEKGRASFTLELCPGHLPFTCCVDLDRGDVLSEVNGVKVGGWSKVYDLDGDGETDYICGSEFMTDYNIGVRFVNQNSLMQAEYGEGETMDLGGSEVFNALFVRHALTEDGGLYLEHLMTSENIPAWREETFSTLAQARNEAEFAPYLPQSSPMPDAWEFHGRLSYQEGRQNTLWVRWSKGYDDVEVCVYRDGSVSCHLVSPDEPESYDLRLYSIPWSDSVPEEYRETVDHPTFRAEDMSLDLVKARGREKDTGSVRFDFQVLHPDGTLVSYLCDGLTAEQVWALVEETR